MIALWRRLEKPYYSCIDQRSSMLILPKHTEKAKPTGEGSPTGA